MGTGFLPVDGCLWVVELARPFCEAGTVDLRPFPLETRSDFATWCLARGKHPLSRVAFVPKALCRSNLLGPSWLCRKEEGERVNPVHR